MNFDAESKILIQKLCRDFVILSGKTPEAYHIRSKDRMNKESFIQYCTAHVGDLTFTVKDPEGKETTDVINSGVYFWNMHFSGRQVVRRVILDPGAPPEPDVLNRWEVLREEMIVPDMTATVADIMPFLDHLAMLSGGDAEGAGYFMNWLATLYQRPEIKIPSAIIFYSKYGGLGKSKLHKILAPIFGSSMVGIMPGHELHKNFADALEDHRIIILDELARSDKVDSYEKFKNTVSEESFQFEGKNMRSRKVRNIMHFIICTNNADCLPLMENDRRFLVLRTDKEPPKPEYFQKLIPWMEGEGARKLAGVLAQWEFPADWDPYAPVPQTEATQMAQEESRVPMVAWFAELIEERRPPFDVDHDSASSLAEKLEAIYPAQARRCNLSMRSVANALAKVGAEATKTNYYNAKGQRTTGRRWVWRNKEEFANEAYMTKWFEENQP